MRSDINHLPCASASLRLGWKIAFQHTVANNIETFCDSSPPCTKLRVAQVRLYGVHGSGQMTCIRDPANLKVKGCTKIAVNDGDS
jgi:hypothetical protein